MYTKHSFPTLKSKELTCLMNLNPPVSWFFKYLLQFMNCWTMALKFHLLFWISKSGFSRENDPKEWLAYKSQAGKFKNGWLYAREAENLVATHSRRLDASVVPILLWRSRELLHSCWSLVHIERLKKLVQRIPEKDGSNHSQRLDVLTSMKWRETAEVPLPFT